MKKRKFTRKGAFKRYITLRGGRDGIPFCYGALQGGRGEGIFVNHNKHVKKVFVYEPE